MIRLFPVLFLFACGGSDADEVGIASECGTSADCPTVNLGRELGAATTWARIK